MRFKKILITGGAGCIGIQTSLRLLEKKIAIKIFDLYERIQVIKKILPKKNCEVFYGSIMDEHAISEAMKDCDGVLHLAAYLGVQRTEKNKRRCLDININGTKNIVDAVTKSGKVKKVIFASSSEVYGEPIKNPVSENDITQGKTVYAISKLAGEELVKTLWQEHNIPFSILRYFNTYGPYQVKQFVIPKLISQIKSNKRPIIYGSGKQLRSYCYSKDTATATIKALLTTRANNEIINIGNNKTKINLIHLVKKINKILKKNVKIKYLKNFVHSDRKKNREIYYRFCNIKKAQKLLKYRPKYTLEQGIKEMIKINSNPDNWNKEKTYDLDE